MNGLRAAALELTLLAAMLGSVSGCSPEPRYQGLPASYWLKEINSDKATQRYHAAHALGEFGPKLAGALPALIKALKDPHPTVRYEAVIALGRFGADARDAIPVLRECLHDPEDSVRTMARQTLNYFEATGIIESEKKPEKAGK